jgi:translation initiation factor 2B subunit (eIF-2B alpha/beta/delta family)
MKRRGGAHSNVVNNNELFTKLVKLNHLYHTQQVYIERLKRRLNVVENELEKKQKERTRMGNLTSDIEEEIDLIIKKGNVVNKKILTKKDLFRLGELDAIQDLKNAQQHVDYLNKLIENERSEKKKINNELEVLLKDASVDMTDRVSKAFLKDLKNEANKKNNN